MWILHFLIRNCSTKDFCGKKNYIYLNIVTFFNFCGIKLIVIPKNILQNFIRVNNKSQL